MKKVLFFGLFTALGAVQAFAQQPVPAKNVASHVGQQITVADSVYSVKYYNDSTAVMELGGKGAKAPLNIVFKLSPNARFNPRFLKDCKQARLEVTGEVVSVLDQPTMVITDKTNVHFYMAANRRKWMTFAQLNGRKY